MWEDGDDLTHYIARFEAIQMSVSFLQNMKTYGLYFAVVSLPAKQAPG